GGRRGTPARRRQAPPFTVGTAAPVQWPVPAPHSGCPPVKDHLRELVMEALLDLRRAGTLPADADPGFVIERARSREHGDYASNVAMLLAKVAGRPPRELATLIAGTLPKSHQVERVEIAGP